MCPQHAQVPDIRECVSHGGVIALFDRAGRSLCGNCAEFYRLRTETAFLRAEALELLGVYRAALEAFETAGAAEKEELRAFLQTLNVNQTSLSVTQRKNLADLGMPACIRCRRRLALHVLEGTIRTAHCGKCARAFGSYRYRFRKTQLEQLLGLVEQAAGNPGTSENTRLLCALEVTTTAAQLKRVCEILCTSAPLSAKPSTEAAAPARGAAETASKLTQLNESAILPCARCGTGIGLLASPTGGGAVCSACARVHPELRGATADPQRIRELARVYRAAADALGTERRSEGRRDLREFLCRFDVDMEQTTLNSTCDWLGVGRVFLCPGCRRNVQYFLATEISQRGLEKVYRACLACSRKYHDLHWMIDGKSVGRFAVLLERAACWAATGPDSGEARAAAQFLATLRVSVEFDSFDKIRSRFFPPAPSPVDAESAQPPADAEGAQPRMRVLEEFAAAVCGLQRLPKVALKKERTHRKRTLLFRVPDGKVAFTLAQAPPSSEVTFESFLDQRWGTAADFTLRAARVLLSARTNAELAALEYSDEFCAKAYALASFPCGNLLITRLKASAMNSSQDLFDLLGDHTADDGLAEDAADQRLCDRVYALNREMVGWAEEEVAALPLARARFPFLAELYRDALRCCWGNNSEQNMKRFQAKVSTNLKDLVEDAPRKQRENTAKRCARTCVLFMAAQMQPEVSYRPRFETRDTRPFVVMPEWVTDDANEEEAVRAVTLE
eukprot:gnl/Chilomastix_cuspidata/55.p1 GENE.gnl/Chilomastix_cuspidata/55~~gnl/Chilomastix_cuspidata/55.p1  ORF type:complete len:731 (+),score=227.17 gnl/Chilomastix_cuspidata/55:1239-3431(+)